MSDYQTVEAGSVRWKTYPEGIIVTDLQNAGKRGGRCTVLDVGIQPSWATAYYQGRDVSAGHPREQLMFLLSPYDTFGDIVEALTRYVLKYPDRLDIEKREERSIDVTPAAFHPITLRTPHIELYAGADSFVVRDVPDMSVNGTTLIQPVRGKAKAVKKFYAWAAADRNAGELKTMTFGEVTAALGRAGIDYHLFCAMD
jgi:hypothetical protein